jgi:hypothetical protein
MQRNLENNLSYIIRINGEWVPAMPDDEEFSVQEIRDYVAGPPQVTCLTPDGYTLFQNTEGASKGLEVNETGTSICNASGLSATVRGRVFLAHPAHIPAFWKNLHVETDSQHAH